ncbi:MAG: deoxyribose-phosphate aldolase [Candidatus Eisenbacteria bacterium]|nr:deoxyribose-phosphate aldolase [Candidatus Eisenbacteria bacterium]
MDRLSNRGSANGVPADLARAIDHTVLKATITRKDIDALLAEAKAHRFASVCVNPCWVPVCRDALRGTDVLVCTVIGFPLGANSPETKAFEARRACYEGAQEVDMVLNVGALKGGDLKLVEQDIRGVVESVGPRVVVKVILETAYLTREEKIQACRAAMSARAHFVKTSTGFGPSGATAEDVRLMRETVGPGMGVKASGGIRTRDDAEEMLRAGASRIGASASVAIVQGEENDA